MRIGNGYDVHQLVKGRPLILGGVNIPSDIGLLGHSDADVLLHAITDACLGALALGDIGSHFPDTDENYKNANSRDLLRQVTLMLTDRGYKVSNLDVMMIAQAPKLAPYVSKMRQNIADDLQIEIDAVSVKATTNESMGFVGRQEGMACYAVVLLDKL